MVSAPRRDPDRPHVWSALAHRGFRLYWSGAFVSSIGSWLQVTAVLWLVKSIGSDTLVGFVNLVSWVPTLFLGLFVGAMADRMDRRRMVLVSQAVMMVCSVLIGLAIAWAGIHEGTLIAFLTVSGIAYAFFVMAWITTIPVLVPKDDLLSAVTLNNVQFNLARFVGPLVGGWLLAVAGDQVPFYVNALTFGAFMILIVVSHAAMPAAVPVGGNVGSAVLQAFRYVRENPWMARILGAVWGLSFFGFSFIVLLPSVSTQVLHVSEHGYGLLMGMTGFGALGGMLAVAVLRPRVGLETMMSLGALLTAAFLVTLALSRSYWLSCLLAAGAGGSFVLCNAAAGTALQGNVTPEMQGRVSSMWTVAFVGSFPIGGLLLGVLSDAFSPEAALLVAGLACLAVGIAVTRWVSVPAGPPPE